jgi:hypothetical protein
MAIQNASRTLGSIRRTPAVIQGALHRRDGRGVLFVGTVTYLVVYLWAIQDLAFRRGVDVSVLVVDRPLQRMLESAPGAFSYEPIMLLEFGFGTFLFSPINTALGLGLALLVGINLALSYLAITQPKSCGLSAGSGVLAAVPALLAGSACCAPVVLIVLGITATGPILAVLPWLLPLGVVLLIASLVYVAGKIDPTVLGS